MCLKDFYRININLVLQNNNYIWLIQHLLKLYIWLKYFIISFNLFLQILVSSIIRSYSTIHMETHFFNCKKNSKANMSADIDVNISWSLTQGLISCARSDLDSPFLCSRGPLTVTCLLYDQYHEWSVFVVPAYFLL